MLKINFSYLDFQALTPNPFKMNPNSKSQFEPTQIPERIEQIKKVFKWRFSLEIFLCLPPQKLVSLGFLLALNKDRRTNFAHSKLENFPLEIWQMLQLDHKVQFYWSLWKTFFHAQDTKSFRLAKTVLFNCYSSSKEQSIKTRN